MSFVDSLDPLRLRAFGRRITDAVAALTKPRFGRKAARRALYYRVLLCAQESTLLVKLADLLDNVRSRRGTARGRQTAARARRFLRELEGREGSPLLRRAMRLLEREVLAG